MTKAQHITKIKRKTKNIKIKANYIYIWHINNIKITDRIFPSGVLNQCL